MLRTAAFLILATLASSQAAFGQASAGGFGNFGVGSSSGFGSLGVPGGGGGQTTSSGTAGLSSLGAMGATGGQTGAGQTGIGGQSGLGTTMAGGGTFGSFDASFGATQLASGLATAAAVSRATSAMSGGRGGFGGFGGGGFGGRGGFGNQNNNQNQNSTKIRAVLRLGFPVETASASVTSQMVSERFSKMPLPQNLADVQISLDGRTAVLRGRVDAAEDGKLVERLLSLEPGIDSVRNELVVGVAETVATPAPE